MQTPCSEDSIGGIKGFVNGNFQIGVRKPKLPSFGVQSGVQKLRNSAQNTTKSEAGFTCKKAGKQTCAKVFR